MKELINLSDVYQMVQKFQMDNIYSAKEGSVKTLFASERVSSSSFFN